MIGFEPAKTALPVANGRGEQALAGCRQDLQLFTTPMFKLYEALLLGNAFAWLGENDVHRTSSVADVVLVMLPSVPEMVNV